jgi:hypothetical protein
MTLKTPIVEVQWGDVLYHHDQIRDISISLGHDGKSNSCRVTLAADVNVPSRGSPIGIFIYYVGSPYEFNATFTHVGTTYAVGNDQYIEITGGSIVWNSSNQALQNKQYFSGSNTKGINRKDFLVKFCTDKLKKEVVWQASDSDSEFVYVSQNGETDLAFFERLLVGAGLEYKEDNNKIVILDKNKPVNRDDKGTPTNETGQTTSSQPRVFYLDVGLVRDIVRTFQPDTDSSSETTSSTDKTGSANSPNTTVSSPSDSSSDTTSTKTGGSTGIEAGACEAKNLDIMPALKSATSDAKVQAALRTISKQSWKNNECLVPPAVESVSKQLGFDPVHLMAIGCFESDWVTSKPNSKGCLGIYQCCPPSYCQARSTSLIKESGRIGQIYAIGYLLSNTIGYAQAYKEFGGKIPLVNVYAGVLAGGFYRLDKGDGATTARQAASSSRMKECLEKAEAYLGKKASFDIFGSGSSTSSESGSNTTSASGSSTSSQAVDNLPFKCRFTCDMTPRFTGIKSGDMVLIPSDKYTGTEDFVIESVNYNKNGSSFDLEIAAGRPLDSARIAQDEVYNFVENLNTLDKYIKYLWG